jgi:hypothetical protein
MLFLLRSCIFSSDLDLHVLSFWASSFKKKIIMYRNMGTCCHSINATANVKLDVQAPAVVISMTVHEKSNNMLRLPENHEQNQPMA